MLEQLKNPETQAVIAKIATQIVAFLIFFVLLKLFAWKPVLKLLDERRRKIAGEFEHAKAEQEKAMVLKQDYEQRLDEIDEEARKRLQASINEAKRIAGEIREQARGEAKQIILHGKSNIELEMARSRQVLREELADMIVLTLERLLRERVDDERERALVLSYLKELEQSPEIRRREYEPFLGG